MKKALFFQDTKESWFLPDDASEKGLYDKFIYATQGGIVRLTPDMPKHFEGICTGWLQICLGLLIIGENGKASIIHVTPRSNKQPIIDEIEWLGQVNRAVIVFNPIGYPNEEKINEFVNQLNILLSQNNLSTITFDYQPTQHGSIAYHRESQLITMPKRARVGSSQWPLVRENVGIINDFFSQPPQLRLEFNGYDFEDIPTLTPDAKKIFNENEGLLLEDTLQNKAKFKNKLFLMVLNPENKGIFFFDVLQSFWLENKEKFNKTLSDITQAFFDYARGYRQMNEELMKYAFGEDFNLSKIVDEINKKYSSPSM